MGVVREKAQIAEKQDKEGQQGLQEILGSIMLHNDRQQQQHYLFQETCPTPVDVVL